MEQDNPDSDMEQSKLDPDSDREQSICDLGSDMEQSKLDPESEMEERKCPDLDMADKPEYTNDALITNHAEEHDSLLGNPEHDDVAMVKFNCDTAPVDKPAEENSVKCTCTPDEHDAKEDEMKSDEDLTQKEALPCNTKQHNISRPFPMYSGNVISFLTYHWLTRFAVTVYKQGEVLKENLWKLHSKDKCSTNGDRLSRLWEKELSVYGEESASVLRMLWRATWRKSLACGVVAMISLICGIIVPTVLVRGLLTYSKDEDTQLWYGLTLVLLYFVLEIINRLLFAGSWALTYQNGVRVRSGLADLLYSKLLRMHTLRDKSVGQIINIFMNDLGRVFEGVSMVPYALHGPIIAIVAVIYCVVYMGPWALVGATIILAYYPYQVLLSKAVVLLRRKAVVITDSRINLMTEILTHIKLIKLYCWEACFSHTITGIRGEEFRVLRKAAFIQTLSSAVGPLVPVLAGVLMFLAHILSGNDLDAAQPFVVLSVLYLVRPKIAMTSLIIKSFSDSLVACKRIKDILVMPETQPISSFPQPADSTVAMEIVNGTFAWEYSPNPANHSPNNSRESANDDPSDKSADNHVISRSKQSSRASLNMDDQLLLEPESNLTEVLRNINISLTQGQLCGVCGSVGSGKSSLISAILGQMERVSGTISIRGRVAFVPQQAWILNSTLRDNVLFGLPFDQSRYESVLYQCSLVPDIEILPAGDLTEIGERGINLSGGQKQRISLARALYADSDIYLLDDPLSAVDAHVGQHLFEHCIQGALRDKTVLLVTHQLQYLNRCDHVMYMKTGEITESGSHMTLMANNAEYAYLINTHTDTDDKSGDLHGKSGDLHEEEEQVCPEEEPNKNNNSNYTESSKPNSTLNTDLSGQGSNPPDKGQLIEKEEVSKGTVTAGTYLAYMQAAGGYFVSILIILTFLLPVGCAAFTNWWLSYWINQGPGNTTSSSNNTAMGTNDTVVPSIIMATSLSDNPDFYFYMIIYGMSAVCMMLCLLVRGGVYISTALKASRRLHNTVFFSVINGPMSFHDTTPVGRTINRFAKDMDDVDVRLPQRSEIFLNNMFTCLVSMTIVCIVFPWFLIALVPIAVIFVLTFRFYHVVLREVKRVDNVTRSPVSSCLTTTLQGLSMVHAYGKQEEFKERFRELHDANLVTVMLFCCSNRWLTCRLDLVTTVLTTVTALLVVCTKGSIPTTFAGLALVYSAQITGIAQFTVRLASETEALFTSVERIRHYIKHIPSEAKTVAADKRPASDWPQQGAVSFRKYNMRYRPHLPLVLNDINCDIKPQEKVGIVGRTGSGKSSLGVGIYRLVEPASGTIEIDGVDITTIGLEDLRSKLFIIPQDPVLFSGTVRYNLDPFGQYTDYNLWAALESCNIKLKVESLSGGLEAVVGESGENFSVGERQLICLARALLRNAKILILDEATAAIDTETDAQIQTIIKQTFTHCTMLTIAHRLNTVLNYDRIMVLQAGEIVEFDSPAALLEQPNSYLRNLINAADLMQNV